ncbi:hypothetical protein [Agromyces bauzanensis]
MSMTTPTTEAGTAAFPTLTVPIAEAIAAFSAVLPHSTKDPITPILGTVLVSGRSIIATDRYTVGRYTFETSEATEDFLVPREAAEWVSKIVTRGLRRATRAGSTSEGYGIELAVVGGAVNVSIVFGEGDDYAVERMQQFDPAPSTADRFPPVARLIPEDPASRPEASFVALSPENLEKVTGWAKKYAKNEAVHFTLAAAENGSDKPAPVYFKIGGLDGLIQPHLLPRG